MIKPGEKWRCKSKKLRDLTATPTSTVWTSQETNCAPLWRNGTPHVRPSSKPRLSMDTSSECSPLASPKEPKSKSELPATQRALKESSSARRWWKSWLMRHRSPLLRSLPRNCILFSYLLIISFSVSDTIGKEIQKQCGKIFPLQNVLVRKVKLLKKPKFDLTKLMELYQEKPELEIKGKKEAKEEPKNLLEKKKQWVNFAASNHH